MKMIQRLSLCAAGLIFAILPRVASAHEGDELHFSHPMLLESPSPDTKLRLDYRFRDLNSGDEAGQENQLNLEAEYAFRRWFSVELDAPYTFLNPDDGNNQSNFDNIELGFKFANFALEEHNVLFGYGVEFGLPTGDDSKGIGSNNEFEIEPFFSIGVLRGANQIIGQTSFGIPTNQAHDEEVENEWSYGLAYIRQISPRFQGLLELEGSTILNGEEDGRTVVNLAPGIKVRPWKSRPLEVGLSVAAPITNDKEYDYQTKLSVFYHF